MPARLACVKPAASVRSEPGSNSQVGLETLNRLITTFDEVPPFLAGRSRQPPAIHIAGSDGVTFKRVPPKSFVRPRTMKAEAFNIRDPQGLRRPRFSFFIFTCQTARGSKTPLPRGSLRGNSQRSLLNLTRRRPTRRQMTTDWYRLLIHSS